MKVNSNYGIEKIRKEISKLKKEHAKDGEAVLEIPWTAEEWLGVLKHQGKIKHFAENLDSVKEGTNLRTYKIFF